MENIMMRNVSEKMMIQRQQKNKKKKKKGSEDKKKNRLLISINVLGSAGPIRFVADEEDLVAGVIDTALKTYAREGRLPLLGSDANNFLLYSANGGSDALNPWEGIGKRGGRNFVLCKQQLHPQMTEGRSEIITEKRTGWKAWFNKSFSFKIPSY